MIYIKKGTPPQEFTSWKNNNPQKKYENLPLNIKKILRNALLLEQGFICCFCGAAIGSEDSTNTKIIQKLIQKGDSHNSRLAHIDPQSLAPARTLDYNNICASCDSHKHNERHCDVAQENIPLPITPLQEDCLLHFAFQADGTIYANHKMKPSEQAKATQTINILSLNSPFLKQHRENCLKNFQAIYEKYVRDNMDVSCLFDNLAQKDTQGAFSPFFFVPLRHFEKI